MIIFLNDITGAIHLRHHEKDNNATLAWRHCPFLFLRPFNYISIPNEMDWNLGPQSLCNTFIGLYFT